MSTQNKTSQQLGVETVDLAKEREKLKNQTTALPAMSTPAATFINNINEREFVKRIYICAQLLGAKSDLLSAISSWRTEIGDQQTFESLDAWIEETVLEQQSSLDYVVKWHKK